MTRRTALAIGSPRCGGCDPILVDHARRVEAHPARIVTIGERKRVASVEGKRVPRGSRWPRQLLVAIGLLTVACAGPTSGLPAGDPTLARYVPTPHEVVERMLALAAVTADDVLYDLGAGDGRIVVAAAKRYGARAVGVEIDPTLVWFARRAVARERVAHLVTIMHADATTVDVSAATVVTLFLTPEGNRLLQPRLQRQLRPGARIVSHAHDMGNWSPARTETVRSRTGEEHTLYLWRIGD